MKLICTLILAVAALLCTGCAERHAYLFSYFVDNGEDGLHYAISEDGLHWTAVGGGRSLLAPQVGGGLMRDPCIILGGDKRYHMVWTVSWNQNGIGYASSDDLIHWSEQRFLPVMAHEDSCRNCWAPEITYDDLTKQYLIYWSSTVSGLYPADPAVESGYNHRLYCTATTDFERFTPTKCLYDRGFNVIDASIVPYNGVYAMFLKDETPTPPQKNIRIAFADFVDGPYGNPSAPITGDYWAEGPTVLRKENEWIVYFDKYKEGAFGAVTSTDLQHWTDISDRIALPAAIRNGSIVRIPLSLAERIIAAFP